ERLRRLMPIAVICHTMSLIEDDDVPPAVENGAQHLGTLDVIDRRDRDRPGRPGADVRRQIRGATAYCVKVGNRRLEMKAVRELLAPLIAKPRRRQYQDAIGHASRAQFRDDDARLYRL